MIQLELVMLFLFLSALVILRKADSLLISIDTESKQQITYGISILSFNALLIYLHATGLLAFIPFISDPLIYQLGNWSLTICGSLLLVNGVSTWLPLFRKLQRENKQPSELIDLLSKIDRTDNLSNSLLGTMRMVVREIHESVDCDYFCLLLGSSNKTIKIIADPDNQVSIHTGPLLKNENDTYPIQHAEIKEIIVHSKDGKKNLMHVSQIPLSANNHEIGRLYILSQSDIDDSYLYAIAEKLTDKIKLKLQQEKSTLLDTILTAQQTLRIQPVATEPLKYLAELKTYLNNILPVEHIAITIPHETTTCEHWLISNTNQTLHLKQTPLSATDIRFVLEQNTSLLITDIEKDCYFSVMPMTAKSNVRTLYSLPLLVNNKPYGVISFGDIKPYGFTARDQLLLESLQLSLSNRLQTLAEDTAKPVLPAELIEQLINEIPADESFETTCSALADKLRSGLSAGSVRISLLDSTGNFLKSVAYAGPVTADVNTTPGGTMMLDLMPVHQGVISSKLNQSTRFRANNQQSRGEAAYIGTSSTKSFAVAPLITGHAITGCITLTDVPDSYADEQRITVLDPVFSIVRMKLENADTSEKAEPTRLSPEYLKEGLEYKKLTTKMKSSLSSIIGSLELLNRSRNTSSNRYVDKINTSIKELEDLFQ